MIIIKVIFIMMFLLFGVYRICQMTSNKDLKLEIIYVIETILCAASAVVLFRA